MTGFNRYKKIIAWVLLAAFFFVYYPFVNTGNVYAAPEDNTEKSSENSTGSTDFDPTKKTSKDLSGTGNNLSDTQTGNTSSGEKSDLSGDKRPITLDLNAPIYRVTPDPTPSYSAFKGMSDWNGRKVITAPKNTYVLTAATGASAGSSVLYFGVKYVGKDGTTRSQYVFPGIDAGSRSAALLNYYAKKASAEDVMSTFGAKALKEFGYSEEKQKEDTLGAWTVQDYAFQTDAEIASVQSIDVYLAKGQWTVQGLSLYKMNSYKGYEEYGLVSGTHFLDYEGYMVADLVKKNPGTLTLKTTKIDTVISIGGSESLYFDIRNYNEGEQVKGYAIQDSLYSFRLDFADAEGSGIKNFLNPDAAKLSGDMGIVEDITLELQYRDIHGWTRKARLPVILSSYIMARKAEGDSRIIGFAQKGESIAFQGLLPEYAGLVGAVTMNVGGKAHSVIENQGIRMTNGTSKMKSNKSAFESSTIRITGLYIYKDGCMAYVRGGTDNNGEHLQGATLEYQFASATPFMFFSSPGAGKAVSGTVNLSLYEYKGGSAVGTGTTPKDTFLVTLYTNDKKNAGTKGDVSIRFKYKDTDGDVEFTQTYSVKSSAEDFLGPWPSRNGGNFISDYGLNQGGSISFLIEAKNLQEFLNAEMSHLGDDFWEMKNLVISYVERFSERRAYLAPSGITGTNFWITRDMMMAEVFNLARTSATFVDENGKEVNGDGTPVGTRRQLVDEEGRLIFNPDGTPVYVDEDIQSGGGYSTVGGQLFIGDQTLSIEFGKGKADYRDVDYSSVRYSMTYDQTQVDWGFFKKKKTYVISVKVAKDSDVDTGNGDAGSVNYFYFQLVFENGMHSGYVQANQQLAGDAFRSGTTAIFNISTNRDYGNVTAINIVPEDLASDATPFDKLNIDSITVSEQTTGGTNVSYVFDQIGWIDIDFRDEAENSSIRGLRARTSNELVKQFTNPYYERTVKLLCEVSTLPWEGDYNQFQGSVWAKVDYIKASDNSATSMEFDVVQSIAAYQNKSATTMEAATNPRSQGVASAGQGSISDPETMFRAGKTDRFILPPISDLKSLKSITFTAQTKNNEGAYLNIGKVSVSQILKDGPIVLTDGGELYRNFTTKKFTINSESKVYSKYLPMGTPVEIGPIPFAENELVWSSEEWATPVSRIPVSQDDTVNIFVYPTVPGGNFRNYYDSLNDPIDLNEGGGDVHANLAYNIPYSQQMAVACDLRIGKDGKGHTLYYATGIRANNFVSAAKLSIQCTSTQYSFHHAIVQHVRSGVVMSTSSYNFMDTTAVLKLSAESDLSNLYTDSTEESILLSFGSATREMNLQSVNNDVAVAFTYLSSIDGGATEYISPYVYLTDQGYTSIREGLMAELKYDVPYVRVITGYRIAGYGNVQGNITASAGVVYNTAETPSADGLEMQKVKSMRTYTSFAGSYDLSERVAKIESTSYTLNGEHSVTPIDITFTSSEAAKTADSTKDAAVRMKLTYTDILGQPRMVWFEDIRRFIQSEQRSFGTGEPVTIRFFLTDMNQDMGIQSIDLMPYDIDVLIDVPGQAQPVNGASDVVDSLVNDIREGIGIFADGSAPEGLASAIYKSRGAQWTISRVEYDAGFRSNYLARDVMQSLDGLANGGTLRLNSVTFTTYVAKNDAANTEIKNHTIQLVAVGGDVITGTVMLRATTAGFTAHAYRMVGDAGEEITSEEFVISDVSRNFYFYVPKNLGDTLAVYKIEVSPVDAPDLIDTIYISVESQAIVMNTTLSLNGGVERPVTDHHSSIVAVAGDVLKGLVQLENSTEGIFVSAYRIENDSPLDVTRDTIKASEDGGFTFTVPENHTGTLVQYKIEVSSREKADLKDTIYVSVESTPDPSVPEEPSSEEASSETDPQGDSSEQTQDTSAQP